MISEEAEFEAELSDRATGEPALVIDVEVALSPRQVLHLADTLNYEALAGAARRLAGEHIDLVETYAQRLAAICLEDERVVWARVRVEKPGALPGARAAGVEIITRRDERGRYGVSVHPHIPFWWWVVLVLLCFVPALWTLLVGLPPRATPKRRADRTLGSTRALDRSLRPAR